MSGQASVCLVCLIDCFHLAHSVSVWNTVGLCCCVLRLYSVLGASTPEFISPSFKRPLNLGPNTQILYKHIQPQATMTNTNQYIHTHTHIHRDRTTPTHTHSLQSASPLPEYTGPGWQNWEVHSPNYPYDATAVTILIVISHLHNPCYSITTQGQGYHPVEPPNQSHHSQ